MTLIALTMHKVNGPNIKFYFNGNFYWYVRLSLWDKKQTNTKKKEKKKVREKEKIRKK